MDQQYHQTLRVGITAILFALVFRLCAAGAPEAIARWLTQPNMAAFLIYLETGRDVRFSASQEVFWEYAPESAAPWIPPREPEAETIPEPELPVFAPEDTDLTDLY